MPKNRLIFTLIYEDGFFCLSRNFNLQQVGDALWLQKNYCFQSVSSSIDELIILNANRGKTGTQQFCDTVSDVITNCFMPVALGGHISSIEDAELLMMNGADKLVLNTALFYSPDLVRELVQIYGSQCIIASLDYKMIDGKPMLFTHNGRRPITADFGSSLHHIEDLCVGELLLNCIDTDGSSQGLDLASVHHFSTGVHTPIILAGGAGNELHLLEGIKHPSVDAVSTSNLFNFIGDGLPNARRFLLENRIPLASWPIG